MKVQSNQAVTEALLDSEASHSPGSPARATQHEAPSSRERALTENSAFAQLAASRPPSPQREVSASRQPASPSFTGVPVELQLEITHHLPRRDVAALARTSKAMKDLVTPRLAEEKVAFAALDSFSNQVKSATSISGMNSVMNEAGKPGQLGGAVIRGENADKRDEIFKTAAFGLVKMLNSGLGSLPEAERAGALKESITQIASAKPAEFRGAAMSVAASKLPVVPRDQQQAVFDHIETTIQSDVPGSRGPVLKSLAANLFKSPDPKEADSRDQARTNLTKVLKGLEGVADTQQADVMVNLARVSQHFAAGGGDWQTPFNTLVSAAQNGLSPNSQVRVREQLNATLDAIEHAGVTGVPEARSRLNELPANPA